MSTRIILPLFAASTLFACQTFEPAPPPNPQSVVNQRVAIMKGFAGAVGAATNVAQGKAPAASAKTKIATARTDVERVSGLFPPGTALGDKGVAQSRALSTIFKNRSDFEGKFDALAAAFANLDAALAKNAKSEVSAALAATRNACSQCHNKYRAPED
jgi:cytochrome c556